MLVEGFRVDIDYFRKRVFGSCWLSETDMSQHDKSSWTVKSVDEMIHTYSYNVILGSHMLYRVIITIHIHSHS